MEFQPLQQLVLFYGTKKCILASDLIKTATVAAFDCCCLLLSSIVVVLVYTAKIEPKTVRKHRCCYCYYLTLGQSIVWSHICVFIKKGFYLCVIISWKLIFFFAEIFMKWHMDRNKNDSMKDSCPMCIRSVHLSPWIYLSQNK